MQEPYGGQHLPIGFDLLGDRRKTPTELLLFPLSISAGCFAGALVSSLGEDSSSFLLEIILLGSLLLLLYTALRGNVGIYRPLAITLFAFLLGFFWHWGQPITSGLPAQNEEVVWLVEVVSPPKETAKNFRYDARAAAYFDGENWQAWETGIQIYADRRDSLFADLHAGQQFLMNASIRPIEADTTGAIFSYSSWAKWHGRAGSCFVNALSLLPTGTTNVTLSNRMAELQRLAILKFKALDIDQKLLGPIVAMTIGQKTELTPDVNQSFRQSGLAHILAISGFHVGLLYGMLFLLVRWIIVRGFAYGLLRHLLPIVGVWFYAFFCGLAAPVVRAATVLTIYALARATQYRVGRADAYFLSMAAVLLAQPSAPHDVGFYLSFSAVAGIMIFMPYLQSLLPVRRGFWQNFRDLFLISVAAQLATTPLVLLAFQSLPLVGILASAPASLLASPILFCGLLITLLPAGSVLSWLLSYPLRWAMWLMVSIGEWAAACNPSAFSSLALPYITIALIAASVVALAFHAYRRNRYVALASGALAVMGIVSGLVL